MTGNGSGSQLPNDIGSPSSEAALGNRVELASSMLFSGLSDDVLAKIEVLSLEREFPSEAQIFDEGDLAHDLFILATGSVELDYTLPNNPNIVLPITRIKPGEVFAWSALANNGRLTARARALEVCQVFILPAGPLRNVLVDHPDSGYQVMVRLTELVAMRLRDTRMQLRWLHSAT